MKNKKMSTIILIASATSTALIAGLFYAYSCSVNPGLARLDDAEYLRAMQGINRAILNPAFFLSFMGTLLLLPVCAYMHYTQPVSTRFMLITAAALLYVIGSFGVTMFGNVPLNDMLDVFNIDSASMEVIAAQREKFEGPWNSLHQVRTICSILSLVLLIVACTAGDENSN